MRRLAILGSTGSIGRQTLDVVRLFPDRLEVVGLAGGRNHDLLAAQYREFRPPMVVRGDAGSQLISGALAGEEGLVALATAPDVDIVVVATTGTVALRPTLSALRSGKTVALANKEILVMAGALIRQAVDEGGGVLIPIDSEHSAIWQCLQGEPPGSIARITLTASGGALRDVPVTQLRDMAPGEVLRHPTWTMGPKVTVDSANLMNKGLEVIEAHWLFDVPIDRIGVVLHRQSIVHSFVTFDDGSTKAQLGLPDMRLPIQYALSHPERWPNDLPALDLPTMGDLTFDRIDLNRYPALALAVAAGRSGGLLPAALVASDDVAVDAFLSGRIAFGTITDIVAQVVQRCPHCQVPDLMAILSAEQWARAEAARLIARQEGAA
ncbi:MAG TPA: 1-deoxy-D-xylulose-5-phosphate reductoisomerase [Chloroflexota bacterium]|nr:1-deoxy-D-xylulose-5-phosphate reductoisomerase [Chloroflexota bacterium]